jgi:hypothetical protein
MQDVSLSTGAKVQFLPAVGEQTVGNVAPYLASLVQRRCAVVVAVGTAEVGAVLADAPRYPSVRFVVIAASASGSNVAAVDSSSPVDVRSRVGTLVADAVHSARGR